MLAILVGGLWAIISFTSTKQRERAEAELSKQFSRLNMDIDANVSHSADGTYIFANVTVSNIGLKPVYISDRWGESENKNKTPPYHPPFAACRMDFNKDGSLLIPPLEEEVQSLDTRQSDPNRVKPKVNRAFKNSTFSSSVTIPAEPAVSSLRSWELIRVGETRKLPFVVKVEGKGVYLVAYRIHVEMDEEEAQIYDAFTKKVSTKQGVDKFDEKRKVRTAAWTARTFVLVE